MCVHIVAKLLKTSKGRWKDAADASKLDIATGTVGAKHNGHTRSHAKFVVGLYSKCCMSWTIWHQMVFPEYFQCLRALSAWMMPKLIPKHMEYQTRDGDHNIHEMSVDFVVIARRQIGRPTSLAARVTLYRWECRSSSACLNLGSHIRTLSTRWTDMLSTLWMCSNLL